MKDEGGMTKFKSIFRVPVNIQLEMRGWDRDGVTKQQQQPPVTLLTLGFSFSAEKQRHGDMVLYFVLAGGHNRSIRVIQHTARSAEVEPPRTWLKVG